MASTTIKVSTGTRDRIKAMGADTYEDTIVDALEAERRSGGAPSPTPGER